MIFPSSLMKNVILMPGLCRWCCVSASQTSSNWFHMCLITSLTSQRGEKLHYSLSRRRRGAEHRGTKYQKYSSSFFFFSFSPLANIFSKMSSDFLITFCFHRFHTFVPSHDLSPRHWRFLFGLRRWSPFWPEQIFVCSFSTCYCKLTMTSKQKGKEV